MAVIIAAEGGALAVEPVLRRLPVEAVTVFALDGQQGALHSLRHAEVVFLPPSDDMPGYMQGLERHLEPFAAIITSDPFSVASFQGMHHAHKNGKPCCPVSAAADYGFLKDFQNLKTVFLEMMDKAHSVFCWSPIRYQDKLVEMPDPERIVPMPFDVEPVSPKSLATGRRRFREMLGFPESDLVLLVAAENPGVRGLEGLFAAVAALGEGPARIRLLFVDPSKVNDHLKYKAWEAGCGGSTYFMHQRPDHFQSDLLAASDLLLRPEADHPRGRLFPFEFLNALRHEVIPLSGMAAAAEDSLTRSLGYPEHFQSATEWRRTLSSFLRDRGEIARWLERGRLLAAAQARQSAPRLETAVGSFLLPAGGTSSDRSRYVLGRLESLEGRLGNADEADLAPEVSELIDPLRVEAGILVRAYCVRARAHEKEGRYVEAIADYEACLRLEPREVQALERLGRIALRTQSYEEALAFYRRLIAVDPNDAKAAIAIGSVYGRLGMVEEAVHWLERACHHNVMREKGMLAMVQVLNGLPPEASVGRTYKRLLDSFPGDRNLLFGYSRYLSSSGNGSESERILGQLSGGSEG